MTFQEILKQSQTYCKVNESYIGKVKIITDSSNMEDFVTSLTWSTIIDSSYLRNYLLANAKPGRYFTVEEYNGN